MAKIKVDGDAKRPSANKEALEKLGRNLRRLREESGFSQLRLGLESGVSLHYISDLECGRRNPSFLVLFRIAKALGVGIGELVDID